ncbi:DUF4177 domain-containing protein [Paracoccus caeni]|uniref:DUF4177 domain-containing protein n=1 Tax=Paracoccus caeni TaxID=657651 RepID=A0A934SHE5_9RHOB|nr:DUF4177 domain-containing protein [Paracoccus caeni]MBK4215452.1 DUF4177 domain-containing protein [Paracoccus caeni]
MRYEYTAIAAPNRGEKAKDAKTPTDRYALSLTAELNRMAADGWEYVRADVLPSEERSGLTSRTTVYHNLLVFRRELAAATLTAPAPQPEYPVAASPARAPEPSPATPAAAAPQKAEDPAINAARPQPESQGEATPPAPRVPPSND